MRQGWEYKKLGEVAPIICGKDYKSVLQDNGQYPIYGSGGIMGYASEYRCPENCTIVGRKGSINNPLFVTTKFWNVDTAFGLNPKLEFINPKYLYYFCTNFDFNTLNVAVTLPSLRRTDVENISISIPPLTTQQSIVSELDTLSQIIADYKEQLADYDKLEQSIFYDMFGDPVKNEKGWEVKSLKDLCRQIGDGLHGTPDYSSERTEFYFVNGNNLCDGKIEIKDNTKTVTELSFQQHFIELDSKTLLISINGTLGKVAYYRDENIILGKSACYLKIGDNINLTFLFNLLSSSYFKDYMESECTGSTIRNVSLKSMRNYSCPLPPLPLQQQFASKIESIEQMKADTKAALQDAELLFQSRMDYWFNA